MLMKKPRPVPAGVFYAAKTTDNRNLSSYPNPSNRKRGQVVLRFFIL